MVVDLYKELGNLGKAIIEYCGINSNEDLKVRQVEALLSAECYKYSEKEKRPLREIIIDIIRKESHRARWKIEKRFEGKNLREIVEETKSKGVKIFVDALNYYYKEDLIDVSGGKIYFTSLGKHILKEHGLYDKKELNPA